MTSSTLITDYSGLGLLAARPVTPNISAGATAIYYATDTALAYAWNGAAWVTVGAGSGLYGQVMSATPTSASTGLTTWLNQNGATVTDAATGVTVNSSSRSGAVNLNLRYKAHSGSHKYTALIAITANWLNAYCQALFGWTDGTQVEAINLSTNGAAGGQLLAVARYTNVTTGTTALFTAGADNFAPQLLWVQIEDDGTNIYYRSSSDGANFVEFKNLAKSGSFLGASGYTNICFGVNAYSSNGNATILSWAQT